MPLHSFFDIFRTTLHPSWFQGKRKQPPYFEGWYLKLVDQTEAKRYAVIPGLFRHANPKHSHAFVQVLDGSGGQASYHHYSINDFWAAGRSFDVRIGPNRFGASGIELDIQDGEQSVQGELVFGELSPWPVSLLSPGIMGWYAWLPFMECYHGVPSLDHSLSGELHINGTSASFDGGRGYIEKDWGRAFPSAWVWMQTNHFETAGTSLTASVATIPWMGGSFRGLIIGLWHQETLYRFATYTGAKLLRLDLSQDRVHIVVNDRHRRRRLKIEATRTPGAILKGPSAAGMHVRVPESLSATVQVELTERRGRDTRLVYRGEGRNGGLEVGGSTDDLLCTG